MSKNPLEEKDENVEELATDNTSYSRDGLNEKEMDQLKLTLSGIGENSLTSLLEALSSKDREQLNIPFPSKRWPEFIAAKELEEIWGNYFRQNEEEIKAKSTDEVELPPSFTEGLYSDKKRSIVDSFLSAIGLRSYK